MGIRKKLRSLPEGFPKKMLKRAAGLLPVGVKFGRRFSETYSSIEESQWWSKGRLVESQREMLAELLEHAYRNVPYYRRVFDERGLKPSDIGGPDELCKLPFLTKDIIRANKAELIARNIDRDECEDVRTRGFSGAPMVLTVDEGMMSAETAFMMRAFESHGSRLYREKSIWLGPYAPAEGAPLYRHEPQHKMLHLSSSHLSERVLLRYTGLMEDFGADLIVGHPSALYAFALLLKKARIRPPGFKVAHACSERPLPEWKSRTEEVLGCPVKDHYATAEKVALFHRCSVSELYHENLEYGVTEIVDVSDGKGEIVGTGLRSRAMPLIRFRTGDIAKIHDGAQRCACGRGLPLRVSAIEGRSDDIIVTPDWRYIPGINFYALIYRTPGVAAFRVIQHSIGSIEVQAVPAPGFNSRIEAALGARIKEFIGGDVEVRVAVVENIRRSGSAGRFKRIESRIPKRAVGSNC